MSWEFKEGSAPTKEFLITVERGSLIISRREPEGLALPVSHHSPQDLWPVLQGQTQVLSRAGLGWGLNWKQGS